MRRNNNSTNSNFKLGAQQERAVIAALKSVNWSRREVVIAFLCGATVGVVGFGAAVTLAGGRLPSLPTTSKPKPRAAASGSPQQPDDASVRAAIGCSAPSVLFRRVSDHYVAEWDSATRNPRWVAERLTRDNLRGDAQRGAAQFREESSIPPHLRAHISDYVGSGFDRGHLAPAADQRSGTAAMRDSFMLSNISPQVGAGFNRDYWARLERFARDLTRDPDTEEVLVVTGPLFLPNWKPHPSGGGGKAEARRGAAQSRDSKSSDAEGEPKGHWEFRHRAIGEPLRWVGVPTHFYKIALARRGRGGDLLAAFVLPNAAIPPETSLSEFVVPVRAVEAAAGLQFFRDVLSDEEKQAVDSASLSLPGGSGGWGSRMNSTGGTAAIAEGLARLKRHLVPKYAGALPSDVVSVLGGEDVQLSGGKRATRHLCRVIDCSSALPAGFSAAVRGGEGDSGGSWGGAEAA